MRSLAHRVKNADVVDWAFGVLFFAVGAAIVVLVYSLFVTSTSPWQGLTYVQPARVITEQGAVPSTSGLKTPSIVLTDDVTIPIRVTRVLACDTNDCPKGSIPITVDIDWVRLDADGNTGTIRNQITNLETAYIEGEDYERGQLSLKTTDIQPFEIPDMVRMNIAREELVVSTWRIEGRTTPQIPGGVAATWVSEPIQIRAPREDGQ